MRKIGLWLLLLLFTPAMYESLRAQEAPHRMVMQLSSGDTLVYKGLFKQLNNLQQGWGDSVTIMVVCHGPGMDLLIAGKSSYSAQIPAFQQRGIRFVACENTLRERQIPKESLLPNLDYVRMGLAEIVVRQEAGWSYIKAGF